MRLLAGAQLSPNDVQAMREGYDLRQVVAACLKHCGPDPPTLEDQVLRARLAAVAAEWQAMEQVSSQLDQARHCAQVARAAHLLLDAALVELALSQQP